MKRTCEIADNLKTDTQGRVDVLPAKMTSKLSNHMHLSNKPLTMSGNATGSNFIALPMSAKPLLLLLLIAFLMAPTQAQGQAWSGILDQSRAIDWTQNPGATFAIPSASWTQCATAACNTVTSAGTGVTAAQINAAIASAPANTYVKLGSGIFNLSSCVSFSGAGHVVLRGNGPTGTIIKFSGSCGGNLGYSGGTDVSMSASSNLFDRSGATSPGGSNMLSISGTAGSASGGPTGPGLYPQGATQITVTGVGSDTPKVGTLLFTDQADDLTPSAGWLQCVSNATNPGCSQSGGTNNGRIANGVGYNQIQAAKIIAINGSTYTISPGLYANNLRASQSPGAWWNFKSGLCTQCGIENVTLDHTNGGALTGILFYNCYQCWVKNVRSILGGARSQIYVVQSAQSVIRDSYIFATSGNSSGGGYGIDILESSDFLIENNIFDRVDTPIIFENGSGFVIGYNFTWNNIFVNPNWMQISYGSHDDGNMMNLWEGNYLDGVSHDSTNHGVSPVNTFFRNDIPGQMPVPNDKTEATVSVEMQSLNHAENFIGNTFGMITCAGGTFNGRAADKSSQCVGGAATGPSYHTAYETSPTAGTAGCAKSIYTLGWASAGCASSSGNLQSDAGVASTMMRWGNYDTVHATVQWNNSEVPTTGTSFLNAMSVPTNHNLPPSFYYISQPSWWAGAFGTPPFPPIGPDVIGGNLAGLGGHAYENLARLCYENTPQDSTHYSGAGVIAFDANSCYGTGATPPPIAPTKVTAVLQ